MQKIQLNKAQHERLSLALQNESQAVATAKNAVNTANLLTANKVNILEMLLETHGIDLSAWDRNADLSITEEGVMTVPMTGDKAPELPKETFMKALKKKTIRKK